MVIGWVPPHNCGVRLCRGFHFALTEWLLFAVFTAHTSRLTVALWFIWFIVIDCLKLAPFPSVMWFIWVYSLPA